MSHEDRPDFVPKVHPLSREAAEEDPLELMAEPVPGDPLVMLECILQEFAWMGYTAEQLVGLFHNPGYPVLGQLREHFGAAAIEQHVHDLVSRWGVLSFRETVVEPDECDELDDIDDHELVQLQLYSR